MKNDFLCSMQAFISHKTKQLFVFAIKLTIVIAAAYFIYQKLAYNSALNFDDFTSQVSQTKLFTPFIITALLFASFLNWLLEVLKWRTLVSHLKKITIWESTAHTLGSLTASLFTPNRVGEYGAKALFFGKTEQKRIVGLNFLGNLAQLAATVVFGIAGLIGFVLVFSVAIPWNLLLRISVVCILFLGIGIWLIRKKPFQKLLFSWKRLRAFFASVSGEIHLKNLCYALLRYLIFAHQFYILLYLFDPSISYGITMCMITSLYLITSLIPMLFIFDVVVKGSVAVWLFSYLSIPELTILSVVALMWILNFVLPSIMGSYFVMTFSVPTKKSLTS